MTDSTAPPKWFVRTMTWLGIGVALLVVIHFIPFILPPKLRMASSSPRDNLEAQVLVRPARGLPVIGGYLSLFTGKRVDVVVRVQNRETGRVLYQEVLFPDEDQDTDADDVEIDWKTDGSVKFDYERRKQNLRFYPPPP